jgi:hypothetical protein
MIRVHERSSTAPSASDTALRHPNEGRSLRPVASSKRRIWVVVLRLRSRTRAPRSRRSQARVDVALCLLVVATTAAATFPPATSANVVSGQFDSTQVADVAIGVPFDDVNGKPNAGSVTVLYGGFPQGLPALNAIAPDNFNQSVEGLCCAEPNDQFGSTLAVGNFNGDAFDDLAIAAPYEDVLSAVPEHIIKDAGIVTVLYGSPSGLHVAGSRSVSGFMAGRPPRARDRFGSALAAGNLGRNFGGNAYDDLAVGVPYADVRPHDGGPRKRNAGAVNVFYGRGDGFDADVQTYTQESPSVGTADAGDHFGSALAAASFNGDGLDDLAVGVPFEDVAGRTNAGAVNVLYGSPLAIGLDLPPSNFAWNQNFGQVPDKAQAGDRFGSALAAANLGRSQDADLAIGVPTEDVGGVTNAGAVNVLYGGGPFGLTDANSQVWYQNTRKIKGSPGIGDRFGAALAATDLVLAIGVPFESADGAGRHHAGAVSVLYGDETGVTNTDDLWHRDSLQPSIPGATGARAGDRFGTTLAVAPVGPQLLLSDIQLVIGAPFVDVGAPSITNAGAVNVLYRRAQAPAFVPHGAQEWTRPDHARDGDRFGG